MTNYYTLLDLIPAATAAEITESYRFHAAAWHPDRHSTANKSRAEAKMKQFNEAYRVLSDPQARHAYDASLGLPATIAHTNGGRLDPALPSIIYDRVADLLCEGKTAQATQELIHNAPGIAAIQLARLIRRSRKKG